MTEEIHQTGLSRFVRSVVDAFVKDRALWVGFGVFWLWPWLLIHLIGARSAEQLPLALAMYDRLSIFVFLGGVLLAFACLFIRRGWELPSKMSSRIAGASITLAACLQFVSLLLQPEDVIPLMMVATARSLSGGIGIAILGLGLGRAVRAVGAHRTVLSGALASVASSFVMLALTVLPALVSQVVFAVVSVACLFLVEGLAAAYEDDVEEEASIKEGSLAVSTPVAAAAVSGQPGISGMSHLAGSAPGSTNPNRVPWKLTLTAMVWAASFGAVSSVFEFGSYWSDYGLVAYAVSSVAVVACMLYVKADFNTLMYRIGFLIAAFGLAIMLFVGVGNPVSYMIFVAGYRFIELLIWGLYAHLMKTRGLATVWTIGLNVGAWTLSRYGGYLIGCLVLGQALGELGKTSYLLILSVELLLLVSALFLSSCNNTVEGWGMERVAERRRSEYQVGYCCKRLAAHYGLTLKEGEILEYIAKGMSRSEISEKLVVSLETTKTHVRHIYKKMGVNSYGKILDLVDKEIEAFEP